MKSTDNDLSGASAKSGKNRKRRLKRARPGPELPPETATYGVRDGDFARRPPPIHKPTPAEEAGFAQTVRGFGHLLGIRPRDE